MSKIILASKSKARGKLLKTFGIKFKAVISNYKEDKSSNYSVSKTVVANALGKAKVVASKYKSGIVVGADTVILCGKEHIGKPKTKAQAFKILKLLSGRRSICYTGLAVIDIDSGRVVTECEKTDIHMIKLSDFEIKNYINKALPFDKAGAFDIAGLGGVLIDRIEGCFYNVVGLPLARLAIIFKKLKLDIF